MVSHPVLSHVGIYLILTAVILLSIWLLQESTPLAVIFLRHKLQSHAVQHEARWEAGRPADDLLSAHRALF